LLLFATVATVKWILGKSKFGLETVLGSIWEMREAERDCLEPIAVVRQEAVEVALVMKIVRPCC
jgi:hypothetical protein